MPSLGYLIDAPQAIASQQSPRHWPMALLLADRVYAEPPPSYMSPHVGPYALDQDGLGACVAFAACTIWNAAQHADWGDWRFVSGKFGTPTVGDPTGAYLAYKWLKIGTPDGSFPGDGQPGLEGSWPEAVWKMAVAYGLPDKFGVLHKATAYYAQQLAGPEDWEIVKATIMQFGPVNVASMWPGNWFGDPVGPKYLRPAPGGAAGAHSYTVAGWETYEGEEYVTCLNTWGGWGSPQGIFRFPVKWLYSAPLGPQIAWKLVDRKDAPTPTGEWVIHFAAGAKISLATIDYTGPVRCIKRWTLRTWGSKPSSASCKSPYRLPGCSAGSALLVRVTSGVYAGKVVRIRPADGVTATPKAT
jgi:hypothetical protein